MATPKIELPVRECRCGARVIVVRQEVGGLIALDAQAEPRIVVAKVLDMAISRTVDTYQPHRCP